MQTQNRKLDANTVEGFVKLVLATNFDLPTETPGFHKELWDLCCSENELVAVAAPRGHAKSTAITKSFVLAACLFRQSQFVLLVSDTYDQAVFFLGDIKKELQLNAELIDLFKVRRIPKDTESDIIVEMEDGYCFRIVCKGSEQKVRGLKWNDLRPDLIIGDDLENEELVSNQERRDKFRRWFFGALLPVRRPGGKVRLVGTIMHLDSCLNRLMPMERAKETIYEDLKTYSTKKTGGWVSVKYKAHNKDFSKILWEARFSKDWFKEEKEKYAHQGYPEIYSQEFLNVPLDEDSAFFKQSDFHSITHEEWRDIMAKKKPLTFYAGADLAISDKERADFSVFHVVGVDQNGVMFHMDTIRERLDAKQIVDTILNLQKMWNLAFFAIEKEKISKAIGPFLKEEMLKRGIFSHLVEITPSADKKTRARGIQGRMRIGGLRFNKQADFYNVLESEFLRFPKDVHDDQVDAMSTIGLALDKITAGPTLEEAQEEEWQAMKDEFNYEESTSESGASFFTGY